MTQTTETNSSIDAPASSSDDGSAAGGPVPALLKNPLSDSPSSVEWIQELELGYNGPKLRETICFSCGKGEDTTATASPSLVKLSKCGGCHVAAYCSRDCQVKDWKGGGHKMACPSYARVADASNANNHIPEEGTRATIRNELFARIRFYTCPYAVFRSAELGRGFVFLQTDKTLAEMSLYHPKDCTGRPLIRSVLLHYLTLGEFDTEVCREDFELAMVRTTLMEAVNSYNSEKEVVLLCRFRCGHLALGKAVLVPDYGICKRLGQDYYANNSSGALQLNLDDL
jgi:hypothetical protein